MIEVSKEKAQLLRIDGAAITTFRKTPGSIHAKMEAVRQDLTNLFESEAEARLLAGIRVVKVESRPMGGADSPDPRIRLKIGLEGLEGHRGLFTRTIEIGARSGKSARVAGVHASRKITGTMAVDFRSRGPRRPS